MFVRLCKICFRLTVAFVVLSVAWVLLYKWVPVKWTPLMLKRSMQNVKVEESFRDLLYDFGRTALEQE